LRDAPSSFCVLHRKDTHGRLSGVWLYFFIRRRRRSREEEGEARHGMEEGRHVAFLPYHTNKQALPGANAGVAWRRRATQDISAMRGDINAMTSPSCNVSGLWRSCAMVAPPRRIATMYLCTSGHRACRDHRHNACWAPVTLIVSAVHSLSPGTIIRASFSLYVWGISS